MGGPLEEMRRLWKFAEAQGFDWFSVSDHFQESPPRGGDLDCYEAIATLTAAAMDTRRIRLGSGVYCVAYRNPRLLAKSLTTIDHLSGGRVDCGLGAGWHDVEAKAFGVPFPSIGPREDMLEEYAQIMRLLDGPISLLPCVSLYFYERCKNCDEKHCGLHGVMSQVRDANLKILEKKTIADLAK